MFQNPNWANSVKLFEEALKPDLYLVSPCCQGEIVKGSTHDPYPLGRNEYNGNGITYYYDICAECGKEVYEPAEECAICGEIGCMNDCEVNGE